MLDVTTDGEHLTCGGFSLGETIHYGRLELLADYFSSLSISPMGNDSGVIFMGTASSSSMSLCTILENSANEFYTTPSREGSSGLHISQRHNMGTPPILVVTTP
jgi:hypothetical protein